MTDLFQTISELLYNKEDDKNISLTASEHMDLVSTLYTTVMDSLDKYLDGKATHGGLLSERDCLTEALKEVLDLNIYLRQLQINTIRPKQ